MNAIRERIANLTQNGYSYDAVKFIQSGISYYREHFLPISLLLIAAALIPVVLVWIGIGTLSMLINLLLITPFVQAALAIYLRKASRKENPDIQDFGKARDYLPNMILFNLLYSVVLLVVMLPTIIYLVNTGMPLMSAAAMQDPTGMLAFISLVDSQLLWVFLLNMIPVLYFYISYWYTPYFIVYLGMQPWEAMEASRKLITKKWFAHFSMALLIVVAAFVLALVTNIFANIAVLAFILELILGVLIAAALYCSIFASYEEIVGLEEESGKPDVLDHLVS